MARWRLTLDAELSGRVTRVVFEVATGQPVRLGRGPRCEVRFDTDATSRTHGQLTVDDSGRVHFEDLGSSGGSYLEGRLVQRAELPVGARLRLGQPAVTLVEAPQRVDEG